MYVPTNIAAPTATYAPVSVTPSPAAIAQPQAVSSVRQTEIALTGLGPAIIPNTVNRQLSNNIARQPSVSPLQQAIQVAADSAPESVLASTTAPAMSPQSFMSSLPIPRPAYIAAQFLAQDLSPIEAQKFFLPEAAPQVSRETQRQQNQLRDMRMALNMDAAPSQPITIRQQQPVNTMRMADVPPSSSYAPALQIRTQNLPVAVEPASRQIRRGSIVQTFGESAYQAANIRNAQLASPPEIDTTL